MFKTFFIGNLTQDPTVRQTTSGKRCVVFDCAVSKSKDKPPIYVSCSVWDDSPLFKNASSYLHKGNKVAVLANMDYPYAYISQKTNEPKTNIKVTALEVEFLANPQKGEQPLPQNIPGMAPNNNYGYHRQTPQPTAAQQQAEQDLINQGFSVVDPADDQTGWYNPSAQLPY